MAQQELDPNMRTLIDALKGGEGPRERVIGQALEDVYVSGKFRTAVLRGATGGQVDVPQIILATRLVTMKKPGGYESTVITDPTFVHRSREFIDKLHGDLDSLPVQAKLFTPMFPALEELITQQGLIVMAAQHLSRDLETQKEIGSILYPRVFRTLSLPFIPDDQRDSLGLLMATVILKSVPFGRNEVNFTLPAR